MWSNVLSVCLLSVHLWSDHPRCTWVSSVNKARHTNTPSWTLMHILNHCICTHTYAYTQLPPLPTSALFKRFGPHVTWHLSADNGIYSQLLSRSALKPPHTGCLWLLLNTSIRWRYSHISSSCYHCPLSVLCAFKVQVNCKFTQHMQWLIVYYSTIKKKIISIYVHLVHYAYICFPALSLGKCAL